MTTLNNQTLTLKAFKHIKSMSQETLCFTATVCLDGKPIATAENDGHGGCTFIHLNAYGASIPAVIAAKAKGEFEDGSLTKMVDAEAYAWEQAAEETRLRNKVAKDLKSKVIFAKRDRRVACTYFEIKTTSAEHMATVLKQVAARPDVECVFNLLPFDQAFARLVVTR